MEKLDKETLAINYLNSVSSYDIESLISMGNKTAIGGLKTYKAGLEYAEEHYISKLESMTESSKNWETSYSLIFKEFQTAKELLKKLYWDNVKEYNKEIEEFLKQ